MRRSLRQKSHSHRQTTKKPKSTASEYLVTDGKRTIFGMRSQGLGASVDVTYYPEREIVNHLLVGCVLSLWMQQMPEVCRPMLRRT